METKSPLRILAISSFQGYLKEISLDTKLKFLFQIQMQFSDSGKVRDKVR